MTTFRARNGSPLGPPGRKSFDGRRLSLTVASGGFCSALQSGKFLHPSESQMEPQRLHSLPKSSSLVFLNTVKCQEEPPSGPSSAAQTCHGKLLLRHQNMVMAPSATRPR